MGERQILPVQTKQILKRADRSKLRSKLMAFIVPQMSRQRSPLLNTPLTTGPPPDNPRPSVPARAQPQDGVNERARMNAMVVGGLASGLHRELEEQEVVIRGVLARLAQARTEHIPPDRGAVLSGPAQLAFSLGLAHLRSVLITAELCLNDALRETRRALTLLDSRGG